jgi:hypothetical protein
MDIPVRLEKMRFLLAEMQVAFQLTKHAPDSFTARTLALHIVMRAENFIDHARAIRKPLNLTKSSDYHIAKEAYAETFAEYFRVARDKIGAHFQDLDFGKRIEIWNAIDQSKIGYFVDGAIEIYAKLASVPDYAAYVPPATLSDPAFKSALAIFSLKNGDKNFVEMSADPLAVTRENSTAVLNSHPIHARAGQVTLIKRWIVMLTQLLARFGDFSDIVRILRADLITDFVSYSDCLVTRPVQPGEPQEMDGLNTILAKENISASALDEFVSNSRFAEKLDGARAVRNKVGAHLDDDDAQPIAALLAMLDGFDLDVTLDFLERLHEAFRAVCVEHPILRLHAADGQRVYGVTASKFPSQPYSEDVADSGPSLPRKYSDDEESYHRYLRQWLDGDGNQKGDGRQFFLDAVQQSEVIETIEEKEMFGQSYRLHQDKYRKVHKFFADFLSTCSLGDFSGVIELFQTLAGMDPHALAQVLARVNRDGDPNKGVWISFALGRLAAPYQSSVMNLLNELSADEIWSVRLQAIIARFKVFVRAEGFYRANNKGKTAGSVHDLITSLLEGRPREERLIILLAVASQLAWGLPFQGIFDADRVELNGMIEKDAFGLLGSKPATEFEDNLRKALEHGDYVCVSAMLAQQWQGVTQRERLRKGVLEASCNGTVLTSPAIGSARNLAICFLFAEQYEIALEQARVAAARKPGDLNFVGTILTVLTQTPGAERQALAEIARLKADYKLEEQNIRELDDLAMELRGKLGDSQ